MKLQLIENICKQVISLVRKHSINSPFHSKNVILLL